MQVKLLKKYLSMPVGTTTEVSERIGRQLVADKFAEVIKTGAKPRSKKVAAPSSVKG